MGFQFSRMRISQKRRNERYNCTVDSLAQPKWTPYVAMWRVEELLRKVTTALNAARVPYAVVGGNAVAAWVSTVEPDAVRATKDVDLLTRREMVRDMVEPLGRVDLVATEVMGVHMFVERENASPKRGVHLVMANERIRAHYAHPAPDVAQAVTHIADYPVIDLPALVAMKLQSFRDVDRTHIRDLLGVHLIDPRVTDALPPDLRARLDQILASPES